MRKLNAIGVAQVLFMLHDNDWDKVEKLPSTKCFITAGQDADNFKWCAVLVKANDKGEYEIFYSTQSVFESAKEAKYWLADQFISVPVLNELQNFPGEAVVQQGDDYSYPFFDELGLKAIFRAHKRTHTITEAAAIKREARDKRIVDQMAKSKAGQVNVERSDLEKRIANYAEKFKSKRPRSVKFKRHIGTETGRFRFSAKAQKTISGED